MAVRPPCFKSDNTPLTNKNWLWRRISVQNLLHPAYTTAKTAFVEQVLTAWAATRPPQDTTPEAADGIRK